MDALLVEEDRPVDKLCAIAIQHRLVFIVLVLLAQFLMQGLSGCNKGHYVSVPTKRARVDACMRADLEFLKEGVGCDALSEQFLAVIKLGLCLRLLGLRHPAEAEGGGGWMDNGWMECDGQREASNVETRQGGTRGEMLAAASSPRRTRPLSSPRVLFYLCLVLRYQGEEETNKFQEAKSSGKACRWTCAQSVDGALHTDACAHILSHKEGLQVLSVHFQGILTHLIRRQRSVACRRQ